MSELLGEDRTWIDGVADRFEHAWKTGQQPRIEDYLAETEGARRNRLLEELLRIERELRRAEGVPPTVDEYHRRFPGDAAVVDTVFGPAPQSATPDTDRNLLFAVIALQNNFIEQADLIAAFHSWTADKAKPLGQVLVERGALDKEEHALAEVLVSKHLKKHGGDVRATLGAVADAAAREAIRSLDDAAIRMSISSLPPAAGYVLVETLIPPSEQRERYTLTRLHAQGGLGRVWLARDTDLNRDVALKEILPGKATHPEMWRRFLKEAQVTGQLEHPNIVPVYELARRPEDNQPFYTMRFVRGRTLRQAIAEYHTRRAEGRVDPLDQPRLLQAFISVCQAIGFAHSRGVIHRDLKPDNVVLGGFGEVLVLDWGLAKTLDRHDEEKDLASLSITDDAEADATREGQQLGTPAYMAPEQAEGRIDLIDGRTDIYGLGAVLFEILTGNPPHRGKNIHELIYRIATGETPRARAIESFVPAPLDAICAKAMAKERGGRYAKATQLAEDVQRWLADEPVCAYREGLSRRLARWGRRNRVWVQAGAVVLLLVAVVASVSAIAINAARRETTAALHSERLAKANAEEKSQAALKAETAERIQRLIAEEASRRAQAQAKIATSRQLAALSVAERDKHFDRSLLLAIAALQTENTFEARDSLYNDLQNRPGLTSFLHINEGNVRSVTFSPDGRTVAVAAGADEGGVVLWDVAARKRLINEALTVAQGDVWSVAFSPDGKILAAGYVTNRVDSGVVLIDLASGKPLSAEPILVEEGQVWSVAFSPDGKTLAAGYGNKIVGRNGGIVLWDVATRRPLIHESLSVTESDVRSVAFSPDSRILAAGYDALARGGGVVLWDVAAHKRLGDKSLLVKEGPVWSVAFSPDGKTLAAAVGSADGGVVLWDVAAYKRLGDGPLPVREGPVQSVAFSADGETLAAGYDVRDSEGGVVLWDVAAQKRRGDESLLVKEGSVRSVAFSPDGKTLVIGYSDWSGYRVSDGVVLWDVAGRERLINEMFTHRGGLIQGVTFSPDGKTIAVACYDGVTLMDVTARTPLSGEPLLVEEEQVWSVAFSPDGKTLAAGYLGTDPQNVHGKKGAPIHHNVIGEVGGVVLWDVGTHKRLTDKPIFVEEGVRSVAFSPDGKTLAAGFGLYDGGVMLWNMVDRKSPGDVLLSVNKHSVTSVSFSPDGKTMAAASYGGVVLIDLATRKPLSDEPLFVIDGKVGSVAFSPDGKILAAGCVGGVVLWDVAARKRLINEALTVAQGDAWSVAFSPDGKTLAAGYFQVVGGSQADGGVALWDVKSLTRMFHNEIRLKHEPGSVAFSPDGKTLAIGIGYSAFKLLDVDLASWQHRAGRIANRNFTREEWRDYFPETPYHASFPDFPVPPE